MTIKTSSATTEYPVTSSSKIDKDGKTTLSALAVGDNVAFSTVTTDGATAIDTLIAGTAPPGMAGGCGTGGGSGGAPSTGGTPPTGAQSGTGSSSSSE